jgi:hypothetical protein
MSRGDACVSDAVRRREVLAQYLAYSIREGRDIGRCVHLADRTRYEGLGFGVEARFAEPTTGAEYVVMIRYPSAPTENGVP